MWFAEWSNWPVHEHFLQDAGVFQIAIGLMMALAVWWHDVLAGFMFTNLFHALNHYLDRAHGGHDSDTWLLAGFAILAAAELTVRLRSIAPEPEWTAASPGTVCSVKRENRRFVHLQTS